VKGASVLRFFLLLSLVSAPIAQAQAGAQFVAKNREVAQRLTDEKLEKFLVFWSVRDRLSRSAREPRLLVQRDGGYGGVVPTGKSPKNTKLFPSPEDAAAAQSGLTVEEGMQLFLLLVTHYNGIYAATNSKNDQWLAQVRQQFGSWYGPEALALVTRHEKAFVELVAKQMEAFKNGGYP
jgi:hypothetical protein